MKKSDWKWMPHPAHFICSKDCKFFLATEVGGYIVSTVGEYWPDSKIREIFARSRGIKIAGIGDSWDAEYMEKIGFEEFGHGGYLYETMVFKSAKMPKNGCDSCAFKIESGKNIDLDRYKTGNEARKGHYDLCRKWARRK